MFKIAIIVFRECLEVALLLSIIMAATKPIKNSRLHVLLGIILGAFGAGVFAFFAQKISKLFLGIGDELFDSGVIMLTVVLLIWTIVWMQGQGGRIKQEFNALSTNINSGTTSQLMLIFVVASTILREGTEIILFIYSVSSVDRISIDDYLLGLFIGSVSGFILGYIIYIGLIKLAGKYIFKVSSILLILIAAGLASEAAGILTSAGIITVLSDSLWDSSWLIANDSAFGKLLHIIAGYTARPNGMQIIFYSITMFLAIIFSELKNRSIATKRLQHKKLI